METFLMLLFLIFGIYISAKLTTFVNYWTFGENRVKRKLKEKQQEAEKENKSA